MNISFQDFYRALSNQPVSSGSAPFSQLGAPDNLSGADQYALHQKMLQDRANATIQTIDPGTSWGGLDKNAIDPQDVMSTNGAPWLRMEKI